MRLLEPLSIGARHAHQLRNRVMFGPHVTNLGDGRSLSARHVAYYLRRAAGGSGTIVTEEASVHDSDWPYERAPLASACADGWARIAQTCHEHGATVVAALGHSGGQGSSAYHQRPLLAPSRVPEVNTREVPKWMEPDDIEAVTSAFAVAARTAIDAGCDGVEINAGQHSLVRQFLSGLTNHRDDEWGHDRTRFARDVLAGVRATVGPDALVGLRLSCDELAPWAGVTPDQAPALAVALSEPIDYLVVVRGAIFSVEKTRPDAHEPAGFNIDLTRAVRASVPDRVAVVLQGSIVDHVQAEEALRDGVADAVEMTRAQIADADLVTKLVDGTPERIRPCVRCNQLCQVRDVRNPIVSCIVEPSAGHETDDPDWYETTAHPREVLIVGGGPAGLEAARVAATRGHTVHLREARAALGGAASAMAVLPGHAPFNALVAWLSDECARLGVEIETDAPVSLADVHQMQPDIVIVTTGSRDGRRTYDVADGARVTSADDVAAALSRGGEPADDSPVCVWDPIGGPIGVSAAEALRARGHEVVLLTPDLIAGNELSRTGDLAPANVRLQAAGVVIERRSLLRAVTIDEVEVEDRFTGQRRRIAATAVIDAGHRLPNDELWTALSAGAQSTRVLRAGDVVAPRTVFEAILEGRRAALAIDSVGRTP